MSDALRAKLEAAAKAGSRSLQAEIVTRLEASFPPAPEPRFDVTMQIGSPIVRQNKDGTFTELTIQEFARELAIELKKN